MPHVIRAALLLTFGLAAPAQAITFATGQGTDSAGCGAVASPCRSLQQAVINTPAGGYVVLRGPSDFGPAFINKSISVVGENGATIRATTAPEGPVPIEIRGGAPDFATSIVRVRGLTIEGAGVGKAGIVYLGGARVEISNCVIRNFDTYGVLAQPALGATGLTNYNGAVSVIDTVIENAGTGVYLRKLRDDGAFPTSLSGYFDGLQANSNKTGVHLDQFLNEHARAVAINSSASRNLVGFGARFSDAPASGTGLFLVRSTASNNSLGGVLSSFDADGAVSLSRSVLTSNAYANGGTKLAHSYGGNVIRGNADDTLSKFALQPLH